MGFRSNPQWVWTPELGVTKQASFSQPSTGTISNVVCGVVREEEDVD